MTSTNGGGGRGEPRATPAVSEERERGERSVSVPGLPMVVLAVLPASTASSECHSTPVSAPAEDVIEYSEDRRQRIKMEISAGVFDTRHPDNTEVLLALLTQNKELEGESNSLTDRSLRMED